jgi:DNA-binding response OmpR family regulator
MSLRVDLEALRVWQGDKEVELTSLEWAALKLLWENKGRILSHATLMDELWWDDSIDSHRLHVLMFRLRSKLGDYRISNRRSLGYGLLQTSR